MRFSLCQQQISFFSKKLKAPQDVVPVMLSNRNYKKVISNVSTKLFSYTQIKSGDSYIYEINAIPISVVPAIKFMCMMKEVLCSETNERGWF